MTQKKYNKKIKKRLMKIGEDLANIAVAQAKLDLDSANVHLLEKLNEFEEFVEHHSPYLKKF